MTLEGLVQEINSRLGYLSTKKDTLIRAIKYAWNYEEKHCKEYFLEEAVTWFRANSPAPKKLPACIFVQYPKGKSEYRKSGGEIRLHHCFVNEENNTPLLDGQYPHRVVYTLEVGKDLLEQLAGKELLLLK